PWDFAASSSLGRGWLSSSLPVSFSCWVHFSAARVNTHAAPVRSSLPTPTSLLSPGPPISAVLPSEESAALEPNSGTTPTPTLIASLGPCWVHFPSLRVNTQAAPSPVLSLQPPISPVLPYAASATLAPNL